MTNGMRLTRCKSFTVLRICFPKGMCSLPHRCESFLSRQGNAPTKYWLREEQSPGLTHLKYWRTSAPARCSRFRRDFWRHSKEVTRVLFRWVYGEIRRAYETEYELTQEWKIRQLWASFHGFWWIILITYARLPRMQTWGLSLKASITYWLVTTFRSLCRWKRCLEYQKGLPV